MRRLAPLMMFSAVLILAGCGDETAPDVGTDAAPAAEIGQTAVMPEDAPPQEEAVAPGETDGGDCLTAVGKAVADRLVERCIAVSPATHPPCNVANPCALIQDEIDRACGQYGPGEDKPAECAA